ncbi:hypothetical protein N431DRAFT_547843 [Stipitochalara longipes BDJ]|nr:hypothetical protein N431DRAFT_547843 [Stipitochalara longipes BDJ]
MYAILGALAGVASIGGSLYYSLASWTAARAKAREEGRREVLGQLAKFGPNRVRFMCLEVGIEFIESANEDSVAERRLEEEPTNEIRAGLGAELRESMKGKVEGEVRTFLREENLKGSTAMREEVRTEIKHEIRAERTRSGRDVALIAEVMTESRAETREALKNEMRCDVWKQLRNELEGKSSKSYTKQTVRAITTHQIFIDASANNFSPYLTKP